jgi:hypothetical protein
VGGVPVSVDYFLVCENHKESMFITNNKSQGFDRPVMQYFYLNHILTDCKISFVSEYDIANEIKEITIDDESCGIDAFIVIDPETLEIISNA